MELFKIGKMTAFDGRNFAVFSVLGRKVAVIRLKDGSYHAVESSCKHQGADLFGNQKGDLKSQIITCPRHGWQYDLISGECVSNNSVPLKIFKVEIREDEIWIGHPD